MGPENRVMPECLMSLFGTKWRGYALRRLKLAKPCNYSVKRPPRQTGRALGRAFEPNQYGPSKNFAEKLQIQRSDTGLADLHILGRLHTRYTDRANALAVDHDRHATFQHAPHVRHGGE